MTERLIAINQVVPYLWQASCNIGFWEKDVAYWYKDVGSGWFGSAFVIDLSGMFEPYSDRLFYRWVIEDGQIPEDENKVRRLARLVASRVRKNRHVVVSCGAGLNRSGLIVARALIELGHMPDEAINIVRWARGPYALTNPHFNRWLQKEGPSLASDLAAQESR